jgi:hypothetical protein
VWHWAEAGAILAVPGGREVPMLEPQPSREPSHQPPRERGGERCTSDPGDPRRDRDPREPVDPPARREPEDDPEEGPPTQPPVEDPLDAPGAGEPAWRDPAPREPPRVEP